MAESLETLDWRGAKLDRIEAVERDYQERLVRTDWLYENLEAKAQRVLSIVVPLGSAAFVLAASQADLPVGLEWGLWVAAVLFFISGFLAWRAMGFRGYAGTGGILPRTPAHFRNLDEWLSSDDELRLKMQVVSRIYTTDKAIRKNTRSNESKTFYAKWAMFAAVLVAPTALVISFLPSLLTLLASSLGLRSLQTLESLVEVVWALLLLAGLLGHLAL